MLFNIITGKSGSFLREKMVHNVSKQNIIVCDYSKLSKKLGPKTPVPVEITPYSHEHTRRQLGIYVSISNTMHLSNIYLMCLIRIINFIGWV